MASLRVPVALLLLATTVRSSHHTCKGHCGVCKIDNDFEDILEENMRSIIKNGGEGSPQLDPLKIKEFSGHAMISHGRRGVSYTISNSTCTGLSTFVISSLSSNLEDGVMMINLELAVESIHLSGNYRSTGRLALIPIHADDSFSSNVDKMKLEVVGKLLVKEGTDRCEVEDLRLDTRPTVGRVRAHFNVFPNNPRLNKLANRLLERNSVGGWTECWLHIKPWVEDMLRQSIEQSIHTNTAL